MHVRLAPPAGGRRLISARRGRLPGTIPLLLAALSACCTATACHRPKPAADLTFEWTLAPTPPVVGPALLTLRVLDGARRPVVAADFRIEGHMSHPGMAPVLTSAAERGGGVYEAHLEFTMGGDWILLVSGSLSSGATVRHRIDIRGVRPLVSRLRRSLPTNDGATTSE